MADVAQLGIIVELKNGQLVARQLDDITAAGGRAEKQGSELERTMRSLATVFAAWKAAEMARDTALLAARFETLGVAMNAVGHNAGFTAGEMARFDAGLQKTGISMIESRNNLARMAAAQLDLNKATQLGRVAQDAAVIANISSSDAFERLVHGIVAGQPRILHTMGIFANFGDAERKWADSHDRVKESLTQVELANIRLNTTLEEGARRAGVYEAAMGTAGKQIQSSKRYLEDLEVKLGTAFLPETTAAVFAYSSALKLAGEHADGLAVALRALLAIGVGAGLFKLLAGTELGAAIALAATSTATFSNAAGIASAATVGWGAKLGGLLVAIGPVALLITAASLAIYDLNKAFEEHDEKLVEASKNTKQYVDYLKALGVAHSQAGGAGQLAPPTPDPDSGAAARKFAGTIEERQQELDKQLALNAAFNQSQMALKALDIEYDANIKHARDSKEHTKAQLQQLDEYTFGLARAKVAALALADEEARLDAARAQENGSTDRIRTAEQDLSLVGRTASEVARLTVEYTALNAQIAAKFVLDKALEHADANQITAALAIYDNTLFTIDAEKRLKIAGLDRADALTGAQSTYNDALLESKQLVDEASAQFEILKKHNEQVANDMREPWVNFLRSTQQNFSSLFETGISDVRKFADAFRSTITKLVADLASKNLFESLLGSQGKKGLGGSLAGMLGLGIGTQASVAPVAGGSGDSFAVFDAALATAAKVAGDTASSMQNLGKFAGAAGIALAGIGVAYGIGSVTGNSAAGAVGGAISGGLAGAQAGTAFGPGGATIGAVVGGLVGAAAGLFGAAAAQKDAAQRLEDAARAVALANEAKGFATTSGLHDYVNNAPGGDPRQVKLDAEGARWLAVYEDYLAAISRGIALEPGLFESAKDAHQRYIDQINADADAADAAAKRATERGEEDAQLRLLVASNDPTFAALKRAADERRQIEDLVTAHASDATIALTKLAQAAEDAATAATAAAAAQQKQAAQAAAVQDITVELLNAKGMTQQGADLQFQLDQERRLADAKANQSDDYVQKLLELQQLQRDQRAVGQLIADSGGGGNQTAAAAAKSAQAAVSAVVTDRTALMLVDLTRAEVTILTKIEENTRSGGSGGGAITINRYYSFGAEVSEAQYEEIKQHLEQDIDDYLGTATGGARLHAGSVRR